MIRHPCQLDPRLDAKFLFRIRYRESEQLEIVVSLPGPKGQNVPIIMVQEDLKETISSRVALRIPLEIPSPDNYSLLF
jgi:hypothetical protein